MTANSRYVNVPRGNRFRPSIFSTRYHCLRQLAESLETLVDSANMPRAETIVDFGCAGRPYEELFRRKFARYIGADIAGNPRADIDIREDGSLPLPDGSADCVLSSQVLEHVQRPDVYLAEAARICRSGGFLILSTHGNWPYHPDPGDYRRWTLDGLRLELDSAGFRPISELAVLGRTATALQLLQDAICAPLPRPLRTPPGFIFQRIIGLVEMMRRDPLPSDASVYVILARKS